MKKCCEVNFQLEDSQNVSFSIGDNRTINFGLDSSYVVHEGGLYELLPDKPMINYNVLEPGNNTYEYLGVEPTIIDITEQDIDQIIFN